MWKFLENHRYKATATLGTGLILTGLVLDKQLINALYCIGGFLIILPLCCVMTDNDTRYR